MLSNSSFFQRKKINNPNPLNVSSTMGAEMTAENTSPAASLMVSPTTNPPMVLRMAETAVAMVAPQMNAIASIQTGSGSYRSIQVAIEI